MTEILVEQAGKDPIQDRYITGYIAGLNDFLKTEYQELV
jgi:hypothetical protein